MLKKFLWSILLVSMCAGVPAFAQQETVITVGVPEFWRAFSIETILDEFEAQHPGVRVEPAYLSFEGINLPSPENIEEHLDAALELAQAADVIQVSGGSLSPYATQAGYFLDLSPLAAADGSLNPTDFVPGAWESFQWDNGTWAVPAKIEPVMLIYNPAAFDAAGLTYPNENWTLDDLANAARTLVQRDASGAVTQPGLVTFGFDTLVIRSLIGQSLLDTSAVPAAPRFDTPELQALVEAWTVLVNEAVIADVPSGSGFDFASIPLQVNRSYALAQLPLGDSEPIALASAALPGGAIGLEASGYAVSAGTPQPQLAYELARFLSQNPQILALTDGSRSALTTVAPLQSDMSGDSGGGIVLAVGMPSSPEQEAAITALLPFALPQPEMRYYTVLNAALADVKSGSSDAMGALQSAEFEVITALQAAASRRGTTPLVVATALPQVVLSPGEISLKFSAGFFGQTGTWESLLREFAAIDPQVGEVVLDTQFGSFSDYAERNDCFYLNYNAVPSVDLARLLAIDPYLSADPTFSPDNVAGNTLAQLQRDNRTWAYPFALSPTMLHYHAELFTRAGIPEPIGGWTISAFVDALRALNTVIAEDQAALNNRSFGDDYLLMLIAAFGGLPIDYRTNPPTPQFTEPATVEAIQQVLDLVKEGLISYQRLSGNAFSVSAAGGENPDPLYSESGGFMVFGGSGQSAANPYRLTGYPTGTLNAAAYEIGAGYISATAQSPDACYRLFQFLSQHPELFDAMPAFRTQFENPSLTATAGENAAEFYRQYDAFLRDPSTIVFPPAFTGDTSTSGLNVIRRWLDQAFDGYVLDNGDLLSLLTEAQTKASAFQACVSALLPFDAAQPEVYGNGVRDCALSVDPDADMMFPRS